MQHVITDAAYGHLGCCSSLAVALVSLITYWCKSECAATATCRLAVLSHFPPTFVHCERVNVDGVEPQLLVVASHHVEFEGGSMLELTAKGLPRDVFFKPSSIQATTMTASKLLIE